jgi:hypothetical protein
MPDNRDAIRDSLAEALQEHGLSLQVVTWKEDLGKRTLTLSLKISGELDVQQELPLSIER